MSVADTTANHKQLCLATMSTRKALYVPRGYLIAKVAEVRGIPRATKLHDGRADGATRWAELARRPYAS
jgi:hypothetical protein